jgi:hypothetical protein
MKGYRAGEHYRVHMGGTWPRQYVSRISCMLCVGGAGFSAHRAQFEQPAGSRSGQVRYNRMRAAVVSHLAQAHPGSATERGDLLPDGSVP